VRIIRDEAQPDQLLPDVYLKNVIHERPVSPELEQVVDESRERKASGSKIKFQPVLEPLAEINEPLIAA
jgi:hypothetical protein